MAGRGDTHRLLVVGLGNRGTMWGEVIAAHGRAVMSGAVDPDPERRERFAAAHPAVPLHPSLEAAFDAGGHDAVVLVTPPDGHLEQARAVFSAGLPLLAEKPLALDLAEAAEIVRLGEAAGLPLTVGLNFRYLPVTAKKRALLASGTYGTPGFGRFVYARNRDGRRPGLNRYPLAMRHPMMLEQTVHHLDLIRHVYAREVVALSCRTWNPPWSMYAHDSNVDALLWLEGEMEVNYHGTWTGGSNTIAFEWRTDLSDGIVVQRALFADLAAARPDDAAPTPVPIADARPFLDDTSALLSAFLDALETGGPAPCDGRDHLATLAVAFAGIEASGSGRVVHMRDFMAAHGIAP